MVIFSQWNKYIWITGTCTYLRNDPNHPQICQLVVVSKNTRSNSSNHKNQQIDQRCQFCTLKVLNSISKVPLKFSKLGLRFQMFKAFKVVELLTDKTLSISSKRESSWLILPYLSGSLMTYLVLLPQGQANTGSLLTLNDVSISKPWTKLSTFYLKRLS